VSDLGGLSVLIAVAAGPIAGACASLGAHHVARQLAIFVDGLGDQLGENRGRAGAANDHAAHHDAAPAVHGAAVEPEMIGRASGKIRSSTGGKR
jgi:hypothetical protein